jgi:hypothetical protein
MEDWQKIAIINGGLAKAYCCDGGPNDRGIIDNGLAIANFLAIADRRNRQVSERIVAFED